jgi:hypothetical protein
MAPGPGKHPRRARSKDADERIKPSNKEEAPLAKLLTGAFAAAGVLLVLLVARQTPWTLSVLDGGFWVAVVGLALARHVVVSRTSAAKTEGAASDWRPIAVALAVAGVAWVAAQAVGVEPT